MKKNLTVSYGTAILADRLARAGMQGFRISPDNHIMFSLYYYTEGSFDTAVQTLNAHATSFRNKELLTISEGTLIVFRDYVRVESIEQSKTFFAIDFTGVIV